MATLISEAREKRTYKIIATKWPNVVVVMLSFDSPMSHGSWLDKEAFHAMVSSNEEMFVSLERLARNLEMSQDSRFLQAIEENMTSKFSFLRVESHFHFWFTPDEYMQHVHPFIDNIPKVSADDCRILGRIEHLNELGIPMNHFNNVSDEELSLKYYKWTEEVIQALKEMQKPGYDLHAARI